MFLFQRAPSALVLCGLGLPIAALGQTAAQSVSPGPAQSAPQAGSAAAPASAPPVAKLRPVVVTATRTDANAFDVPASIDRIDGSDVRDGRAQINISESLGGVPGLQARDRQNYAQDVQISVRGFGARSTFGIRGVRLYVDGIPATLPDGQGQITNVDLGSVGRIEVLRGPFSALYGNSSGGVVSVFTEEGAGRPKLSFGLAGGSDGARRYSAQASGGLGGVAGQGFVVGTSRFVTDGYRDHSATERSLGNAKLTLVPDDASRVTLVANSVALPKAQDPLGLSRAQYEANPRGVDPSAITFDTRKTVNQTQAGLIYERKLDESNSIRLMGYGGHRGTEQFQSIPVATQASALHPGGVISLGRHYEGTDLRWTLATRLLDAPLTVVGGFAYDTLVEQRQGYQNFTGPTAAPVTGVRGALRRNEENDVSNVDEYLQAEWKLTPKWTANLGVRHSSVRFRSTDGYVVGTNPNDSGAVSFAATLPVGGLMYAIDDDLHVYVTAGRGFETPTLNELAYRPNGLTGLNFGLTSATNRTVEVGVKARLDGWGEATAALFQTGTDQEIVTQTNTGGRSTFQNVGATRRRGLELGWSAALTNDLRAQAAWTFLDATYSDAFASCVATPCTAATQTPIAAGNRIPGIARTSLFANLTWTPPAGLRGGLELRQVGKVYVNDLNSDAAPGYTVAAAQVGYLANLGGWELLGTGRVDNLAGRKYAGSVIVNEGNGRFFEPAPGRTWWVGTSASYKF